MINIHNYQELLPATNLIKKYEGLSLIPYYNIYGEVAIGYGATGKNINIAPITIKEAEILLRTDILKTSIKLVKLLSNHDYEINSNQFNAFVSFFNSNYFESSMKERFIKGESLNKIIECIPLYVSINFIEYEDLKKRRREEYKLAKR
jgi:GH24 family phage-related lysozyme (muramidase)